MKKFVIKFLIIRLCAYGIVTWSYVKHGISFWLLFVLFMVIELNVWISFFQLRKSKHSKESKTLLEKMLKNL